MQISFVHLVQNDVRILAEVLLGLWTNELFQEHARGAIGDACILTDMFPVPADLIATKASESPAAFVADSLGY